MSNGVIMKISPFTRLCKSKESSPSFYADKIAKAKLFKSGFVALTKEAKFYLVKSIKNPSVVLFFDMKKSRLSFETLLVVDFHFIPEKDSCSGWLELVFCTKSHNGIFRILEKKSDQIGNDRNVKIKKSKTKKEIEKEENDRILYIKDVKMISGDKVISYEFGRIDAIAFSPSNHLALFTKATKTATPSVFIFNSKLIMDNCILFTFNIRNNAKEKQDELLNCLTFPQHSQFIWCGKDAVCVCSNRYITLLSLTNNTYSFQMVSKAKTNTATKFMHCITEIDGIRVISQEGVSFISRVSKSMYNTCSLEIEQSPSKKLITYYQEIMNKTMKCDQVIKELHNNMAEALRDIYQTALNTLNNNYQSLLLKVINFAKVFLIDKSFNIQIYLKQSIDLKILHLLRGKDRFVTYAQYSSLSIKKVIDLLVYYQHFELAEIIAKDLKYKTMKIHHRWAYAQIKSIQKENSIISDDACFNIIYSKLKTIRNVSYIKLYRKAAKHKREALGLRFLQFETSISSSLPIYLQLKQWNKSMRLAIESNDKYSIYYACDHIFKSLGPIDFFSLVKRIKESETMALEYLERFQISHYINYLTQNAYFPKLFFFFLKNYFSSSNMQERHDTLIKLKDLLIVCKTIGGFDFKFYSSYIDSIANSQKLKIEVYQDSLSLMKNNKGKSPYNNSILDVFNELINRQGAGYPIVENKNKDFKVSQRIISIMRTRYYSLNNIVDGIDGILKYKLKESNLAYIDIGEALFDCHKEELCSKVIEILGKETRYEYLEYKIELIMEMKKYKEAIDIIITEKRLDKALKRERINEILLKTNGNLRDYINDVCKKAKVNLNG